MAVRFALEALNLKMNLVKEARYYNLNLELQVVVDLKLLWLLESLWVFVMVLTKKIANFRVETHKFLVL